MKTLSFQGTIKTGIGKHSNLKIPGRAQLTNAPAEWPENLQPGSLNVLINDSGYPTEFASLQPEKKVKNLDTKQFAPAFTIPHDQMTGNSIKPSEKIPDRGAAQVWRATLSVDGAERTKQVWIHRRIGSGVGKQLEIVSDAHLRKELGLQDGTPVHVTLVYGE